MAELTLQQENELRTTLLNNFAKFAAAMTGPKWFDPILHLDLCNHCQYGGQEIGVVLPRSFLKTTFAGELFPFWLAIREKYLYKHDLRILIVCNTATNAEKSIHQIKSWVETHPLIQQLFSDIIPNFNSTRWSDSAACLARQEDYPEATFESAGVGTNIIRRHYDVIIEDDTIAPTKDALTGEEALPSREDIDKAIGFHKLTMPLLVDIKTSRRVVIATRWADFDLINHIKKYEKFNFFDRKALENNQPTYFRFNMEVLEKLKGIGTYLFSMLYLNTPLSSSMLKFRPEWIQYWSHQPEEGKTVLPEDGVVRVKVDPADAPTGKKSQDYSAITVVKHCKEGLFVVHYVRKRLSEDGLIKEAVDCCENFKAISLGVELNKYASYEKGFKDELRRRNLYISFEGVKVVRRKEERILTLSPLAENRRLFLASGMRELEQELFSFPRGEHDDIIDSLSLHMKEYMGVERAEPVKEKSEKMVFPGFTYEEIMEDLENKGRKGAFRWPQKVLA